MTSFINLIKEPINGLTRLFDVNVLISIVDPVHPFHACIHRWLQSRTGDSWASCPITENGFVRILSQPAYKGSRRTPAEAIQLFRAMKDSPTRRHAFWADDYSLAEAAAVEAERRVTPAQITDVYLLALALRKGGKLLTFDRNIPWQCVPGGTAALIENPAD